MARTISLSQASTLGGAIANVTLDQAAIVSITAVETRSNPKTGKSYFLCTTDAEVMGSPMRVVLNPVGSTIATIAKTDNPGVGDEVICWVTYGEPVDGKQYMTLFPKGHPQFGVRRNLVTGSTSSAV